MYNLLFVKRIKYQKNNLFLFSWFISTHNPKLIGRAPCVNCFVNNQANFLFWQWLRKFLSKFNPVSLKPCLLWKNMLTRLLWVRGSLQQVRKCIFFKTILVNINPFPPFVFKITVFVLYPCVYIHGI